MAEKILSTRIQNKYDSVQNWKNSNLLLKAGEIAIATVEVAGADSQFVPTILMKVGDGSKSFSQLPWMAAKASDVFAWAKLENPTIDQLPINLKTAIINLQNAIGDGGSVSETIQNAIGKLNSPDNPVPGQFVTAVAQRDGIITVTRGTVKTSDISDFQPSVQQIAALEVSKIVAGAPEAFDTLKEIADYITSDLTGAAALKIRVDQHQEMLQILNGGVNTPGSVLNNIQQNAVTQLKTSANGGLVVTGKDTIDIDSSITFVFNCGNSTI